MKFIELIPSLETIVVKNYDHVTMHKSKLKEGRKLNVKELRKIIKYLNGDIEIAIKNGNELYDCYVAVANIDEQECLVIAKEPNTKEDAIALETIERFNKNNISYSIDPESGEIYYTSIADKEKGEKIIQEIDKEYSE